MPLPGWMLEGGATESTQSVSERLELVHPEDRSVAAEMFLTALTSPGRPIDGTYRMRREDRWHRHTARMLNMLDHEMLRGILVIGCDGEELASVALDEVSSNFSGDFTPSDWLVEVLDERARILEIDGMVEEILGRTGADLLGESATQLVAPDSMASAAAMWAALDEPARDHDGPAPATRRPSRRLGLVDRVVLGQPSTQRRKHASPQLHARHHRAAEPGVGARTVGRGVLFARRGRSRRHLPLRSRWSPHVPQPVVG